MKKIQKKHVGYYRKRLPLVSKIISHIFNFLKMTTINQYQLIEPIISGFVYDGDCDNCIAAAATLGNTSAFVWFAADSSMQIGVDANNNPIKAAKGAMIYYAGGQFQTMSVAAFGAIYAEVTAPAAHSTATAETPTSEAATATTESTTSTTSETPSEATPSETPAESTTPAN